MVLHLQAKVLSMISDVSNSSQRSRQVVIRPVKQRSYLKYCKIFCLKLDSYFIINLLQEVLFIVSDKTNP